MEVDIKNEIYLEINKYKNGTEQESIIGNKIEEFANTIKCFRCLDTTPATVNPVMWFMLC